MTHIHVITDKFIGSAVDLDSVRDLALRTLMRKVRKDESGCWLWQGYCHPRNGYGNIGMQGRNWIVHRLMWRLQYGPIPVGMYVCHSCDVPACCNPRHLWIGTQTDNMRDCGQKRRTKFSNATHCIHGHEFTSDNVCVTKEGWRQCKTCSRISQRLKAGWPRHLAETAPTTPAGYRPVNATRHRRKSKHTASAVSPPPSEGKP